MEKGNIHLCHVFATFGLGGPQVRICQIINALPPSVRHTIMAMDNRIDSRCLLNTKADVTFVDPQHKKNYPFYPLRLARLLRLLRPDMVLTYNWGAIEAIVASKLSGIRCLIHGEYGFNPDEALTGQKYRRILARRVILRSADAVVAPSRNLVEIMEKVWKIPGERIFYIANGVDCKIYSPVKDKDERIRLGIPENGKVIGTVGNLGKGKNHAFLLEAMSQLRPEWPVHLVIVGDGPEKQNIHDLAVNRGIDKRVHFMGSQQQPIKYYRMMDIFALASITEQMPVSVLEAMSSGLPIISTDVGDVSQMVSKDNLPYIIPLGDRKRYFKMLRFLIQDENACKAIGRANREKCISSFQHSQMINNYHSLYERILVKKLGKSF